MWVAIVLLIIAIWLLFRPHHECTHDDGWIRTSSANLKILRQLADKEIITTITDYTSGDSLNVKMKVVT